MGETFMEPETSHSNDSGGAPEQKPEAQPEKFSDLQKIEIKLSEVDAKVAQITAEKSSAEKELAGLKGIKSLFAGKGLKEKINGWQNNLDELARERVGLILQRDKENIDS